MKKILQYLIFFLILHGTASPLQAQSILTLDRQHRGEPVGAHLEYTVIPEDKAWSLPPGQDLPSLISNSSPTLDTGFVKGIAYVRLVLRNDSPDVRTILLEQRHVYTPSIKLWGQGPEPLQSITYGKTIDRSFKQIHHFPVFKLDVPPGTHSYWFELKGIPKRLNLYIWDDESFAQEAHFFFILLMMLMVIPLTFILQHAVSYYTHRDPMHLAYVAFVFTVWTMSVVNTGLIRFVLPEEWTAWVTQKGIYLLYLCISWSALRFCSMFIRFEASPRWNKILLNWQRSHIVLLLVLPLLPFDAYFLLILAFPLLSGLEVTRQLLKSLFAGQIVSRYYILGASPLVFQLIYSIGVIFLGFPYISFLDMMTPIAQSTLALGLSLGISKLIEEREKADSQEIASLNRKLRMHITNVEEIVTAKTAKIKSIMAHIEQGIFTINEDGTIDEEHSDFAKLLFPNRVVAGCNPVDLLFEQTDFTRDQLSQIRSALQSVLNEDAINFEINQNLFPAELSRTAVDGTVQIIECDWIPMIDEEGRTERILVAIRDVTENRKLRAQNQQQSEDVQILNELLDVKPLQLERFFHQARAYFEQNRSQSLRLPEDSPSILANLFIETHTLKGISRTLHLQSITDGLHEIESDLQLGRAHGIQAVTASLRTKFQELENQVQRYQERAQFLLRTGDGFEGTFQHQRDLETALQLLEQLNFPSRHQEQLTYMELRKTLEKVCLVPLEGFLDELQATLNQLARNLAKAPPVLLIEQDKVWLNPRQDIALRNTFVHLARNAMDHGLETPQERLALRKNPRGMIELHIKALGDQIVILFCDDGRGLQLDLIEEKARREGWIAPAAKLQPEEIADFIFAEGLSTTAAITDISGRGIGLPAVRHILEDLGGTIRVVLRDGQSSLRKFHFEITFPKYKSVKSPESA